jgi:aminoglycoside/choline kinase family phosphotransferase
MNPTSLPLPPDPPVAAFLARHGQASARFTPLPGDASARRYSRLQGERMLLMEDRKDLASFTAFVQMARHLRSLKLSAPRIHGTDPVVGLALIEDFGTGTYRVQLSEGREERDLYALAIDALLHLHHHPDATRVKVPAFDLATFLDEISLFSQWFTPAICPDIDIAAFDRRFRQLWTQALAPLEAWQKTLVLRDFHIDNLMELPGRRGVLRCGLLDFQDAVLGPAEYDLVSLLQDARRDLAAGLEMQMLARYIASAPAHAGSAEDITQRYHLMGAQRHTRIAGVFLRLNQRDSKPGYLQFLPRVLQQMQAALSAANLHEITDFIDISLPEWQRTGAALADKF